MGAPAQEEQDSLSVARRHPVRWVVIGVVAAVIVGLIVEAAFLLSVRGDLQDGRDALTTARRRALTGDLLAAAGDLRDASTAFASASERADGPLGRAARAIPWLGNSAEAAAALADAGGSLSDAGATLVDALAGLPGGVAALAPSHGALPLDRYRALAAPVQAAAASAAEATTIVAAAPDSLMPSSLASARWDAEAQATRLADDLTGIGSLLGGAPRFGGTDGPQRYLVVAQNPAELRGTGGIWGAYAIATIDDGRVRVSSAAPTQTLRDFPAGRVESPSEDYASNYDQYGGAGSWQNMNITPDFTAAARAALANYELGEGTRLDGVWAVDPFALADFLHVTGPVAIPGVGDISEDDVVAFTTNRAYSTFTGAAQRKEVLGAVATDVFQRFLSMDEHAVARLRALTSAVADGHLRIYSDVAAIERGLSGLGVDGSFAAPAGVGDVTGVTVNNGSGSKIDYYVGRDVSYDVQLGGDGEAISTLAVTMDNGAPTSGQPRYVIGPYLKGAHAGDEIPFTTVWCHAPCQLLSGERDGHAIELAAGSENTVAWLRDYRTISAGTSGTLELAWRAEDVWSGNSSAGSYRLTFLGQTTVRPTSVAVTIHAPAGQRIVWTSEPMDVDGSTATWSGTPTTDVELQVRFRAPLPRRVLRDVTRPVFGP